MMDGNLFLTRPFHTPSSCTGRVPNVKGLNLDVAGVEFDEKRGIVVDKFLKTSNPAIFAAGDVASAHQFTNYAEASGNLVVRNALFPNAEKSEPFLLPWTLYTEPELGRVGFNERDIKLRGLRTATFTYQLADSTRAVIDGQPEGFVKVYTEAASDRILGVTVVSHRSGEILSELVSVMKAGLGLGALSHILQSVHTLAPLPPKFWSLTPSRSRSLFFFPPSNPHILRCLSALGSSTNEPG